MNGRAMKALIKKDVSAITSNPQIWLPLLIVPLLFVVVLPAVILILGRAINLENSASNVKFLQQFLKSIPEGAIKAEIMGLPEISQKLTFLLVNYLFAPLFLIIPTMVSSLVAASSFVGEKEKKTLETLLFSPMRETDMFAAKILASFIPSMVISVAGFLVFSLEFMFLGAPVFGRILLPAPHWLPVVLWLSPALTLLVTFLNVLVSVKVKGFQEAQQISVIVILPILFLVYGQIGGIVFLSMPLVLAAGLGVLLIDAALIGAAAKVYNRDRLFSSQAV